MKFNRFLSGFLSTAILLSTVAVPQNLILASQIEKDLQYIDEYTWPSDENINDENSFINYNPYETGDTSNNETGVPDGVEVSVEVDMYEDGELVSKEIYGSNSSTSGLPEVSVEVEEFDNNEPIPDGEKYGDYSTTPDYSWALGKDNTKGSVDQTKGNDLLDEEISFGGGIKFPNKGDNQNEICKGDNHTPESILECLIIESGVIKGIKCAPKNIGELKLPRVIQGQEITAISDYVFEDRGVTKLVFEENSAIEYIGKGTFKNNPIKEITFPSSLKYIGAEAFYGCKQLTYLNMPSVTHIYEKAFYECTALENVNMPNVLNIGESAFYNCINLTTVDTYNVINIENSAFGFCKKLEKIDMPYAKSIGYNAFFACANLKQVNLPRVEVVENRAFRECSSLIEIDLPSATKIGDEAFYACYNLKEFNMPKVTSIPDHAFAYCTGLESLYLPKITDIGNSAFYGCTNLKKVSVSNTKVIGPYAFSKCTALVDIDMPVVEEIKYLAFSECTDLREVFIPSATKTIEDGVFSNTTSLKAIYVNQYRKNGVVPKGQDPKVPVYYLDDTGLIKYSIERKDADRFNIKVTFDGLGKRLKFISATDQPIETGILDTIAQREYKYTINNLDKLSNKVYTFEGHVNVYNHENKDYDYKIFTEYTNIKGFVNYLDPETKEHLSDIDVDLKQYKKDEKVTITKQEPKGKGKFLGWSLYPNSNIIINSDNITMTSGNLNLYPVFEEESEQSKYATLTLNYGYPYNYDYKQVKKLEKYKEVELPTPKNDCKLVKGGYEFLGWFTEGGTKPLKSVYMYDDVTVYAKWEEIKKPEGGTDSSTESTTNGNNGNTGNGGTEPGTPENPGGTENGNGETVKPENPGNGTDGGNNPGGNGNNGSTENGGNNKPVAPEGGDNNGSTGTPSNPNGGNNGNSGNNNGSGSGSNNGGSTVTPENPNGGTGNGGNGNGSNSGSSNGGSTTTTPDSNTDSNNNNIIDNNNGANIGTNVGGNTTDVGTNGGATNTGTSNIISSVDNSNVVVNNNPISLVESVDSNEVNNRNNLVANSNANNTGIANLGGNRFSTIANGRLAATTPVAPINGDLARLEAVNVDTVNDTVVGGLDKTENKPADNQNVSNRRETEKPAFGFAEKGGMSLLIVLLAFLMLLVVAYIIKKQIIDKEKQNKEEEDASLL
ncbi:leucine-rich repeat domain-containing protein [[Clostridium] colinum]|uniref:leucine-rich repeat domain-containing protein n=1 Tax=[Clostridium] colinum TaxID=36835 RepID=UPI002024B734|nr:leucine-rich repeat domain-containing protein [[Clostridium] colinum]